MGKLKRELWVHEMQAESGECGEPACSGCDGSSKWHSCNAEEFHNPPTEQRYESNLPPKDTNFAPLSTP